MITVSSRDGMEVGGVLGVGRGTGENELEEGEAFSFRDGDDDDDRIIDPDVALSYIDEKIKNLLGHVQKDFEGGVSAENLGAKFGGYGSFLPMYQRSSVLPHSKSPIQTKNPSVPSPPRRSLPEGNQFPPTFSSSPSHVRQHYTSSCNKKRTRDRKSSPSQDNVLVKVTSGAKYADVCNSTILCYKNISPRNASENNLANPADQKMLKLRINPADQNISPRNCHSYYPSGEHHKASGIVQFSIVWRNTVFHLYVRERGDEGHSGWVDMRCLLRLCIRRTSVNHKEGHKNEERGVYAVFVVILLDPQCHHVVLLRVHDQRLLCSTAEHPGILIRIGSNGAVCDIQELWEGNRAAGAAGGRKQPSKGDWCIKPGVYRGSSWRRCSCVR